MDAAAKEADKAAAKKAKKQRQKAKKQEEQQQQEQQQDDKCAQRVQPSATDEVNGGFLQQLSQPQQQAQGPHDRKQKAKMLKQQLQQPQAEVELAGTEDRPGSTADAYQSNKLQKSQLHMGERQKPEPEQQQQAEAQLARTGDQPDTEAQAQQNCNLEELQLALDEQHGDQKPGLQQEQQRQNPGPKQERQHEQQQPQKLGQQQQAPGHQQQQLQNHKEQLAQETSVCRGSLGAQAIPYLLCCPLTKVTNLLHLMTCCDFSSIRLMLATTCFSAWHHESA